jgi:hypothetical protein
MRSFDFFLPLLTSEIKPAYTEELCDHSFVGIQPKGWRWTLSSQLVACNQFRTIIAIWQ